MPNATSTFRNIDYPLVKVIVVYGGSIENFRLFRGSSDSVNGPEREVFRFAWVLRDELIDEGQLQRFGAQARFGDLIDFGSPAGRVP